MGTDEEAIEDQARHTFGASCTEDGHSRKRYAPPQERYLELLKNRHLQFLILVTQTYFTHENYEEKS